jgi:hypothetical protein
MGEGVRAREGEEGEKWRREREGEEVINTLRR